MHHFCIKKKIFKSNIKMVVLRLSSSLQPSQIQICTVPTAHPTNPHPAITSGSISELQIRQELESFRIPQAASLHILTKMRFSNHHQYVCEFTRKEKRLSWLSELTEEPRQDGAEGVEKQGSGGAL